MSNAQLLLPAGAEVPFGEIGAALARDQARDTRPLPARALMATVVAVGETSRLMEAGDVLQRLGESLPVRAILISYGDDPAPPARVGGSVVALQELRPAYVNNAIAALRLSSLPTVVWWRGGPLTMLEGTASLADRVILDVEDPAALWVRALDLAERTAFSDVRWARLTRWRALMAHFFDIPAVQAVASQFTRLQVAGADDTTMALFSGWLRASLGWGDDMRIELEQTRGTAPIERVVLADGHQQLSLQLAPSGHCVKSAARVANHSASRTVSLGDQRLAAVILEELRVRSRDLAFERAVRASLATL